MNRPVEADRAAPVRAGTAGDKRTLVLFLLGGLLLVPGLLPQPSPPPAETVCVETDASGGWRLVGYAAGRGGQGGAPCGASTAAGTTRAAALADPAAAVTLVPELALFTDRPLPINRADEQTLTLLPGIGPRLAAAIGSERQRQGRFTGPESLLQVPGIGPVLVQRLQPLISFE